MNRENLLTCVVGSQWNFDSEKLLQIYGSVAGYRAVAGQALQRQIQSGFLLPADAEILRRETVESAVF